MQPPIYIVGIGAIGMTLAVLLKQAGKNVTLIRGRSNQPLTDEDASITVDYSDGSSESEIIPIRLLDEIESLNGIVLLTTKTYGNQELAQRLRGKTGQSPLMLMQNGLGIEDPFLEAGFPEIYRCVLLATSQVTAPYNVLYKPVSASPVGVMRGHESSLVNLVEQLNTNQFPFRIERDIQQTVWEKVITNCVLNAICPLLGIDNGLFHRNTAALALAREVTGECIAVANEVDIRLNQQDVENRLIQISQRSDGQLISTLVDILHNRPTEIDSLNLAVARLATQLGKPELATRTRLLGELIQIRSKESPV